MSKFVYRDVGTLRFAHPTHCGELQPCLKRGWPLMPPALQKEAYAQAAVGGPRRLPPSTHIEWVLRRYAPSNFVT